MLRICILLGLVSSVTLVHSQCATGTNAEIVKDILTAHNKLRAFISAGTYVAKGKTMPAANTTIPSLTYDCALETSARKAVSACTGAHSTGRVNVGENLWVYNNPRAVNNHPAMPSVTHYGKKAVTEWENQFQTVGWSNVSYTANSGIQYATQMAWAKSTKIGCSLGVCNNGQRFILICHYRDAGNIIDENVYEPK